MGLDAVELVLRAEELFVIRVNDNEAAAVRIVGDFYELVCTKLGVQPLQSPITPQVLPVITRYEKAFLFLRKPTPSPAPEDALPWSPQSVWDCLVAVFVDQLCLKPEKISYDATISHDLGVD